MSHHTKPSLDNGQRIEVSTVLCRGKCKNHYVSLPNNKPKCPTCGGHLSELKAIIRHSDVYDFTGFASLEEELGFCELFLKDKGAAEVVKKLKQQLDPAFQALRVRFFNLQNILDKVGFLITRLSPKLVDKAMKVVLNRLPDNWPFLIREKEE